MEVVMEPLPGTSDTKIQANQPITPRTKIPISSHLSYCYLLEYPTPYPCMLNALPTLSTYCVYRWGSCMLRGDSWGLLPWSFDGMEPWLVDLVHRMGSTFFFGGEVIVWWWWWWWWAVYREGPAVVLPLCPLFPLPLPDPDPPLLPPPPAPLLL